MRRDGCWWVDNELMAVPLWQETIVWEILGNKYEKSLIIK